MSSVIDSERLKRTCCGKSQSEGGLNVSELRSYLRYYTSDVDSMRKDEMISHVCRIINYNCNDRKFSEEQYRDLSDVISTINTNPHYKDMRPHMEEIINHWNQQTCCQLCGLMLEIEVNGKIKGVRDAIDHNHDLETTGINSYRGRLCMTCNTNEGKARKESNGNFYKHVEILSKRLGVCPTIIYRYLYDTYHGQCPMDTTE